MNAPMHRYLTKNRFRLLASYFFLRAQKEVTKKKGTPNTAPANREFPAMLDRHRSLRNSTSPGPAFFGYFLCGGKESNSPAGENAVQQHRYQRQNNQIQAGWQL